MPGTSRISAKHREWLAGYLFVLPDAAGLMLFIGLPAAMALFVSIYSFDAFGSFTYVGAAHYRRMLLDPLFWKSLRVTAVFAAVLVPLLYVAGLGLALLVQRTNRYNAIMRSMLFAPQMVSLVVIGLVWQLLLVDKIGSVPQMLAAVGVEAVSFLGDPRFALMTVVLVCMWFLMGFYMLVFLGGLHDIPKEYYEAAQLDGAGPVARFWYITLPLLRPTSFFVLPGGNGLGRCRCARIRPRVCHDARGAREFDVASDFVHLPAGLSIRRLRLRVRDVRGSRGGARCIERIVFSHYPRRQVSICVTRSSSSGCSSR